MNNVLEYKGYYGTVEYSSEDNVLNGKVIGIGSLNSYEGESVQQLKDDFEEAVEDYLAICEEKGIPPEKAYRGSFNVRVSPELHKKLVVYASSLGQTLNATVEEALQQYVSK